jgi:DNA-binding transcriptional ArsR family regulator
MDQKVYEMHAEICKVFTSPKRLEIIDLLRTGEKSVNDISASIGVSQSNVSQHLTILREKGVVAPRKEGNTTFYRITNPKILEACGLMRDVLLERLEEDRKIAETVKNR